MCYFPFDLRGSGKSESDMWECVSFLVRDVGHACTRKIKKRGGKLLVPLRAWRDGFWAVLTDDSMGW